jgi:DNA-directed RNA polymerase subunit RPC12/RpoP
MNRYDDVYDLQDNATCADCGADYSRAEDDPTTACDPCSDRRDVWAAVTEIRMAQASAPVKAVA